MVSTEKAVIARLDKENSHFEVLVDPHAASDLIDGRNVNILENLAIDTVFKDSKKGDTASDELLEKIFNTTDIETIAKEIILKGNVQLTTQQRREMLEAKKKMIIDRIARLSMDPHTKAPHPRSRIELAMDERGVHIDPFKKIDHQIKYVLEEIRHVLPISMEKVKIRITIPGKYIGKAYGIVKNYGRLLKEEWRPDGSWMGTIEMPPGMQTDLYNKLNEITKGDIEAKILG
jgi:ribosome maturation protein SDO1